MTEEKSRNIKLGLFVLIGTLLLVSALYFIGSKQNLFGSSVRISARFYNVNGLTKGNNVRFAGIDIGTVETVEIENDTSVRVTMIIDAEVKKFIKINSIASVGSDGLMGNKLVNINSNSKPGREIQEGDELPGLRPLEMDEMMRTLSSTNDNIFVISTNLKTVSERINNKSSFWSILMDTVIAGKVRGAVVNLKVMSNQAVEVTGDLSQLTGDIKSGKGTIGALITDTTMSSGLKQTVVNLHKFSDSAAVISGELSALIKQIKSGKGSLGILLNDTTLVHNLNKSVRSIDTSAVKFSENMEALHYSWPFKKYYKKKKK